MSDQHPLTPDRIDAFRDRHIDTYSYAQEIFDAGREHERTNPVDDRPWEPLNGPVRVGDELRQKLRNLTTTAVVALWTGFEVVVSGFAGRAVVAPASDLTAFTLPDGTRARRDGNHADGTPRFVKVEDGQ